MKMKKEVTYEEAFAVCVQHYVDRGYSVEHATDYVKQATFGVFWLYNIIQEEEKLPHTATVVSLIQPVRGETAGTETADG